MKMILAVCIATFSAMLATDATARTDATITFGGGHFSGASTYTEAGYSLTATGPADLDTGRGNPPPAVLLGNEGSLAITNGGLFGLTSIDVAAFNGNLFGNLTVAGYNNGNLLLLDNFFAFDPSFKTHAFGSGNQLFDHVDITESGVDTYIDNLRLFSTAVPEPATWSLMILGFGIAGVASRRHRQGQSSGFPTVTA